MSHRADPSKISRLNSWSGQIWAQPDKVHALKQAAVPQDRKELQCFLGLLSYYRHFVPCFASGAASLTDLLKKGQPRVIQWTTANLDVLEDLQIALSVEPLLHVVQADCPFILSTDNSCHRGGIAPRGKAGAIANQHL